MAVLHRGKSVISTTGAHRPMVAIRYFLWQMVRKCVRRAAARAATSRIMRVVQAVRVVLAAADGRRAIMLAVQALTVKALLAEPARARWAAAAAARQGRALHRVPEAQGMTIRSRDAPTQVAARAVPASMVCLIVVATVNRRRVMEAKEGSAM